MKQTIYLKYKSCDHVPCGSSPITHKRCKPKYCYDKGEGSSKHWSSCNMKNWFAKHSPRYIHQSSFCKPKPVKIVMSKKKSINPYQVDVHTLHNKMPYIWRFLSPRVQKKMIVLANIPKKYINTYPLSTEKRYKNRNEKVSSILKKHRCYS